MAETLKQTEGIPASYPSVIPYLNRNLGNFSPMEEDGRAEPALVWQRIEAYVAHRWTPRVVVWIVAGEGHWTPPLTPATVSLVECWENGGWSTTTPPASPLGGYELPGEGPYRITATVGGGEVPEAVKEAFRRLHEYSRGVAEQWRASASDNEGVVTGWAGKAIQLSGAADLLRPYRRA